jgi:multicomponent K+:H+ antiporter subunit D
VLAVTREAYGEGDEDLEEEKVIGIAIPATMGMLGLAFIGCALVIAGLPPLSGFIAKFALLTSALNPSGTTGGGGTIPAASWGLLVVLILSGLAALIAMTRAGIRAFWAAPDRAVPRILVIEMAPVAVLLILCAMQTIQAGPVMRFMQATAQSLHAPQDYIREVLRPAEQQAQRAGGT